MIRGSGADPEAWTFARLMPRISYELKAIIMVKFVRQDFRRIGQLRAEMGRLDYV